MDTLRTNLDRFNAGALTANTMKEIKAADGKPLRAHDALWLTVWSHSVAGAKVYVTDEGGIADGLPTEVGEITTFPTSVSIEGWERVGIATDQTGTVKYRITRHPRARRKCR